MPDAEQMHCGKAAGAMSEAYRVRFSKQGKMRFVSHLDLVRTFQRSFRRAGLDLRHSEGYVPHPIISIALPLSLGFSSTCELMDFELIHQETEAVIENKLNLSLPDGVQVTSCYRGGEPFRELMWVSYRVRLFYHEPDNREIREKIEQFFCQQEINVKKKTKKGEKQIDIVPLLHEWKAEEDGTGLALNMTVHAQEPGLNPMLVIQAMQEYNSELTAEHVLYERKEIWTSDFKIFR